MLADLDPQAQHDPALEEDLEFRPCLGPDSFEQVAFLADDDLFLGVALDQDV